MRARRLNVLKLLIDLVCVAIAVPVGIFVVLEPPGAASKTVVELYLGAISIPLVFYLIAGGSPTAPFAGVDPFLMLGFGVVILMLGVREGRRGRWPGSVSAFSMAAICLASSAGLFLSNMVIIAAAVAVGLIAFGAALYVDARASQQPSGCYLARTLSCKELLHVLPFCAHVGNFCQFAILDCYA
jgi:hypothetical protein